MTEGQFGIPPKIKVTPPTENPVGSKRPLPPTGTVCNKLAAEHLGVKKQKPSVKAELSGTASSDGLSEKSDSSSRSADLSRRELASSAGSEVSSVGEAILRSKVKLAEGTEKVVYTVDLPRTDDPNTPRPRTGEETKKVVLFESKGDPSDLEREVGIMHSIRSAVGEEVYNDHFCKLYEPTGEVSADGKVKVYMKMANRGDLQQKRFELKSLHKVQILSKVAGGLAVMHEAGIVHRDVASRNVLLHSSAEEVEFSFKDDEELKALKDQLVGLTVMHNITIPPFDVIAVRKGEKITEKHLNRIAQACELEPPIWYAKPKDGKGEAEPMSTEELSKLDPEEYKKLDISSDEENFYPTNVPQSSMKATLKSYEAPTISVRGREMPKLTDFGYSAKVGQVRKDEKRPLHCAPETGTGPCSTAEDVFQFGLLIVETMMGADAYDVDNREIENSIRSGIDASNMNDELKILDAKLKKRLERDIRLAHPNYDNKTVQAEVEKRWSPDTARALGGGEILAVRAARAKDEEIETDLTFLDDSSDVTQTMYYALIKVDVDTKLNRELADLVKDCMQYDPQKRPTMKQAQARLNSIAERKKASLDEWMARAAQKKGSSSDGGGSEPTYV